MTLLPRWAIASSVNGRIAPSVELSLSKSNRVAAERIEPIDSSQARLTDEGGLTLAIARADEAPFRREYAMRSVTQTMSRQAVTVTASRIRCGGAASGSSPMPRAVADDSKIRLGGAWRLPISRKTD